MKTPTAVLRAVAERFSCPYDKIETAVGDALGKQVPRGDGAESRLDIIRRALHTPEGASVIDQAGMVARGAGITQKWEKRLARK